MRPSPEALRAFTTWYFILLHAVFIPWSAYRGRFNVARMPKLPPLSRHYLSTIVIQLLLLLLALIVAMVCRIPLFPPIVPTPLQVMVGLATMVGLVLWIRPIWKQSVQRGDRRLYFFMPRSPGEKALWVGVSLAAGIGEEITYRGVLYGLLHGLAGQWWLAALLSAAIFGLAHAFQSRLSMMIIFVFALVFQALALWTGALYVSMLVHVLYDVTAGLTYSKLGREIGYVPPPATPPPAAPAPEPTPA